MNAVANNPILDDAQTETFTRVDLYTAFNAQTKKVCVLLVNGGRTFPYQDDVLDNKMLRAILESLKLRINRLIAMNAGQGTHLEIVVHRFKDWNLGSVLKKVKGILDNVDLIDVSVVDEYVHKSLLKKNGAKPDTYAEVSQLVYELLNLKRRCQSFTFDSVSSNDNYSKITWTFLKE